MYTPARALLRGLVAFGLFILSPGCVGYVVASGYFQAELLLSRRPATDVLAEGRLSVGEHQRLALVPALKAYGLSLGLSATDNYDTLAVGWHRSIYNVSACEPLSFTSRTWGFPIVGRVPYLGFFRPEDAERRAARLTEGGYEVWVRTAGAYSTLGWFRDPVLPGMLRWSEADLAETVFHELAHATLWIRGSVAFNESFASFVGDVAATRYLEDTYGAESAEVRAFTESNADHRRWQLLLHDLYEDLDKVYRDPALDDGARTQKKAELYLSLPRRIGDSDLVRKARYQRVATAEPWNNARLAQHRTYNTAQDHFADVYALSGDLPRFIADVRQVVKGARQPFDALRRRAETAVQIP